MTGVLALVVSGTIIAAAGALAGSYATRRIVMSGDDRAHYHAIKAEVYEAANERLVVQLDTERVDFQPELTALRDKGLRWRGLALRAHHRAGSTT